MSIHQRTRASRAVLLCALLLGLTSAVARAQEPIEPVPTPPPSGSPSCPEGETCPTSIQPPPGGELDIYPPWIGITSTELTPAGAGLSVQVSWWDDVALFLGSRTLTFNGVNVTAQFSHSGSGTSSTSTGTVTRVVGTNTLVARICDTRNNCTTETQNWTYTAPPVVPVAPPTPVTTPAALAGMDLRAERPGALVAYRAHVQANGGWTQGVRADNEQAGTVGESKAMQAVSLQLGTLLEGVGIEYQAHVGYDGWLAWAQDGAVAGHPDQTLKELQAIRIRLRSPRPGMRVCYRAHVADLGWQTEVCDGAEAGTTGQNRAIQALQVRIVAGTEPLAALLHPEGTVERALCVVAAAPGGAYECGDLRLAHGLPVVRTLNQARAPTLLYNSHHAAPQPIVTLDYQIPIGVAVPDSVKAVLKVSGVQRATGTWGSGHWQAGATKRISLAFNGLSLATGLYPYVVEIERWKGGVSSGVRQLQGEVIVVNRSGSPMGAGWWLAGLEQLVHLADGRKLWVGGDGSARVYRAAGSGVWVAANPQRPDMLQSWSGPLGTNYRRLLPGGSVVWYDLAGQHRVTEDRLGRRTEFDWQDGRLRTVRLPVTGRGATVGAQDYVYEFQYNRVLSGGAYLSGVVLRAGSLTRTVGVEQDAQGRMTRLQDPDGSAVRFGYAGSTGLQIRERWDRNSTSAVYTYGLAAQLSTATAPVQTNLTTQARTTYRTAESLSLGGKSVVPDSAYLQINGPRTDVSDLTRIWTGRWGMPTRIVDALGGETVLTRTDTRFPALVTRVDSPRLAGGSRRTVSAAYDTRGNVVAQTDWSTSRMHNGARVYATTRYERTDTRWPDFVTQVTAPEGEVTRTEYYADGNRAWHQPGTDAARRVTFQYYTNATETGAAVGQLKSVTHPTVNGLTPVERIEYDGRGNLKATVTPKGYRTDYTNDDLGRAQTVTSPVQGSSKQVATSTFYPNSDRVEYVRTTGPALNGAPQMMAEVRQTYDLEGRVRTVARRSNPDPAGIGWVTTEYRYDALGRRTAEVAPDGKEETTEYDAAGNARWVRTRLRNASGTPYAIEMRYDALNRLTRRSVPQVDYVQGSGEIGYVNSAGQKQVMRSLSFPHFDANAQGGLTIKAEVTDYRYDAEGRLTLATNPDANIRRGYHANGLLAGDTLEIYSWNLATRHSYVLRYEYDLNGRRTAMLHPENLVPRRGSATPNTRVTYGYDPATGALQTITDLLGYTYRYDYDAAGRVERITAPGDVVATHTYDLDGNLTHRNQTAGNYYLPGEAGILPKSLHRDVMQHDERGKVTKVTGNYGQATFQYTGLGMLAMSDQRFGQTGEFVAEYFTMDALGNRTAARANDPVQRFSRYQAGTGRLLNTERDPATIDPRGPGYVDKSEYDEAGNQILFQMADWNANYLATTRSFYGADNRLRVVDRRGCAVTYSSPSQPLCHAPGSPGIDRAKAGAFENYRYDPLGRRVLTRMRRAHECTASGCQGAVTRTVWDGDQVLYEIRAPGDATDSSAAMEDDNPTGPSYGRVAYTHGLGIDAPLGVIRMGYTSGNVGQFGSQDMKDWVAAGVIAFVPHANWRGVYDGGTAMDGRHLPCETSTTCTFVEWPERNYRAFHNQGSPRQALIWFGGLVDKMRDGSGYLYMRNRYYNPQTGTFTQEDPIGLAGGLNVYGFANGDPVSYSDPYGLKVECANAWACQIYAQARNAALYASESENAEIAASGRRLMQMFLGLERSEQTVALFARKTSPLQRWAAKNLLAIPTNFAAPCVRSDRVCGGGANFGVATDPTYTGSASVSAETVLVHELGHIYAYMVDGASSLVNVRSVEMENHFRTISGCTRFRANEDDPPPACQ